MTEETSEVLTEEPGQPDPAAKDPVAVEVAKEVSPAKKLALKETQEAIAALEVLADFAAKILADGRVNGADFVHVLALMKDIDVFASAVKGADRIDDELKDLDETEMVHLGLAAYKLIKKVSAAAKSAKK